MNFISTRRIWFGLSTVLTIAAVVAMFLNGFNWGIDFTGGTSLALRVSDVKLEQVRTAVNREKTEVTMLDKDYLIKTTVLTEGEVKTLVADVEKKLGKPVTVLESNSIGPAIGKEMRNSSLAIVSFALIAMLIYITFRFEFWYGVAAVIALAHDCVLTLGFISWQHIDFSTTTIVALLTILGYSINDTIIVFDRVREDLKKKENEGKDIATVTNNALLHVLVRCMTTVMTVLFSVLALYLFGGITLREFSLVLLFGFTFGAYSSLCIASPLLVVFKKAQD